MTYRYTLKLAKLLLGVAIFALFVVLLQGAIDAEAHVSKPNRPKAAPLVHATDHARTNTWGCQGRLGLELTPTVYSERRSQSRAYRGWVKRLWQTRQRQCLAVERNLSDPIRAIHAVFGRYGDEAVAVARCETGGTFSVWASNGQFKGIFQLGEWERATYGHGDTPLEQARAAYRYFAASGYDWSPWTCQP